MNASGKNTKRWLAEAPSNIALIKYMGKTDSSKNHPTNGSLSYTLPHLKSIVELELETQPGHDVWLPLENHEGKKLDKIALSEKSSARFLSHLDRLKQHFGFNGNFVVRSANDFPSDCGLASSASSFAALTMAAVQALTELTGKKEPTTREAAELSRMGSGSSCRSFFAPWAVWDNEGVHPAPGLGHAPLLHQCIVVEENVKAVSSSQAHLRVSSSLLFEGRPERANQRLHELREALLAHNWPAAFEITWADMWDMHALFETSRPSFSYMTAGSLEVLRRVRKETWESVGEGPLITMDAGPNVHLLYRHDDRGRAMAQKIQQEFAQRYRIIASPELSK